MRKMTPRGWENGLGLGPTKRERVLENNHRHRRVGDDEEKNKYEPLVR